MTIAMGVDTMIGRRGIVRTCIIMLLDCRDFGSAAVLLMRVAQRL
mgnify:CR=1 FL=1|jgi:hypothetical protein